jgi:hypothetical protein
VARYGVWAPIPMWVRSTRKWVSGRNGRRLTAVVIHRMEGTLEGSDSYLRREFADYYPYPRLNASTHFGVGLWYGTPQIRQWVDTANTAWGWSARPTDTPTAVARNTLTNLYSGSEDLNWQVISVEVEGFASQAWDYRTRDKVKELLRWIYKTHGNVVVMAHTDCSTKVCPGMYTFGQALPGYYGKRLGTIFGTTTTNPPKRCYIGAGINFRNGPGQENGVYRTSKTAGYYNCTYPYIVTGTTYTQSGVTSNKWRVINLDGYKKYVWAPLVRMV